MPDAPDVGEDAPADGPRIPDRVLSLDLPARGTGARAARRAAQGSRPTVEPPLPDGPSGVAGESLEAAPSSPVIGPSRSFMTVFAGALVLCLLAAGVLTLVGVRTLRDSNAGRRVVSAEPHEPGFEGFLEPTPTLALFDQREGLLQSVVLLSLASGDAGGSVILIPASTNIGSSGTLAYSFAFAAPLDQLRESVEVATAVGINEAEIVDAERWSSLVAPVEPVIVQNPESFGRFPAGEVELMAADVGEWLAAGEDDDELARLYRVEVFWTAWLDAVAESGSGSAVPGAADAGLGRFVRGLASGSSDVMRLPVVEQEDPTGAPSTFDVDRDAARAMLTAAVPYPLGTRSAPRVHVRLLDGTGDQDLVSFTAPSVVLANASIVVVGNADHFDYTQTEIRYHRPEHEGAAEQIREQLGVGEVIEDVRPIDSFGVTIVLGTDVAE